MPSGSRFHFAPTPSTSSQRPLSHGLWAKQWVVHSSLWASQSPQNHLWSIEHICALMNCPSGPPSLPQGPGTWGLGPCFSETQRSQKCCPGSWIWKELGNSACQSPQGSGLSVSTPGPALCPNISLSASSSVVWPADLPRPRGATTPFSCRDCQAGSHGTQTAQSASQEH